MLLMIFLPNLGMGGTDSSQSTGEFDWRSMRGVGISLVLMIFGALASGGIWLTM